MDTDTKPKKRTFEDSNQVQDVKHTLNPDFDFVKLSQRTTSVKNQSSKIQPPLVTLVIIDDSEEGETTAMNNVQLTGIEKIVEAGRRAVRLDHVESSDTIVSGTAPTTGRRALGPSKFLYLLISHTFVLIPTQKVQTPTPQTRL